MRYLSSNVDGFTYVRGRERGRRLMRLCLLAVVGCCHLMREASGMKNLKKWGKTIMPRGRPTFGSDKNKTDY